MKTTAFILLLAVLSSVAIAQEPESELMRAARKLEADPSNISPDSYRSLFAKAGRNGLAVLQRSPFTSVAIQAAWEEVALTVPEKPGSKKYRVNKAKLNWFLGFLEGRARVKAPKWWADAMLNSRAHHRKNIFPASPKGFPYHSTGREISAPLDTTIRKVGDTYLLKTGKDSLKLPQSILRRLDDNPLFHHISGCFTRDCCFVVMHSDTGYPHDVVCLKRSTGRIVWTSRACGCWWGAADGVFKSWVAVSVQGDRVFVFGNAGIGTYAHGFRIDDGKTILQFSSRF